MKKLISRLLIFLIGVPLFFTLVYLLPHYRHLAFNILVLLFSAFGAYEFSLMLEKKELYIPKPPAFIFGAMGPLAAILTVCFNIGGWIIPVLIMAASLYSITSLVFTGCGKMDTVIKRFAGHLTVLIYPGFFMFWIAKISSWENSAAIVLFLFINFANDSLAWLTGILFGAKNKGLVPASPNKSIAGFIGGLCGAMIVTGGAALLFPFIFPGYQENPNLLLFAIILGLFTGFFAILGDLAESAIKRSCDCKDSGKIMFDRGGILDSIDSLSIAGPVYYFLFTLFFLR